MSGKKNMRRDGSEIFHVSDDEAGLELGEALRMWQADPAKSRELVPQRRVMIDGNLCQDAHRRLKQGEVVKVLAHAVTARPTVEDIRIEFSDAHLVVVEKPSGLTTLRHVDEQKWSDRRKRREATLEDLLPAVLADSLQQPFDRRRFRVIPVHRLDRETSGLMVFARTAKAERDLVEQFARHEITRAYVTVVPGDVAEQTIESRFVRDRGDGKRGSTDNPEHGQLAVTHLRPINRAGDLTVVECRLETGRTHQIRIHMSELGHPVCGDKEYRGPFGTPYIPDNSGAPRLALHAIELGFTHPITQEPLHFRTRLANDLHEWLLKQKRSRNK